MAEAVKHDAGKKLRFDLIPPHAEAALAEVFGIGAVKYGARNWELGMDWDRVVRALRGHLNKWQLGETHDAEDGQHHLASVMWCAMVLYEYERRGIGTDNRTP